MNLLNFKYRTEEEEVMDDFQLRGPELRRTLKDLAKVNRWLGGNGITLEGIQKIQQNAGVIDRLRIIDVGCGDGMMLREIADYGRKNNLQLELLGLDANAYAVEIARELSVGYSEISFVTMDIFSEDFENMEADIFLCTLTLHHFKQEQVLGLVELFLKNSKHGVVINDLQRSRLAYRLFQAFCAVFIDNEIARKDGLISIRRGFQKQEIEAFAQNFKVRQEIHWKWAFRYQWILYKNKSYLWV